MWLFARITQGGLAIALLLSIAAGAEAGTIQCASVSGSSLSAIVASGGCSIGDLTFSDFVFQFTPSVVPGEGASSPATPNAGSDVTLDFAEITDGVTPDPFGTVGSTSNPVYQVIFNFSGGNSVSSWQSEQYILQYLVTDSNSGTQITEVDDNIAGGASVEFGSTGSLTYKSLCDGGAFNSNGDAPTGTCSTGAANVYPAVAPNGGTQFLTNPDPGEADSSIDYNSPDQKFGGSIGSANFGVYDQADLNAGSSSYAAANLTQIENDFVESSVSSATPEPGGGFALVACCSAFLLKKRRVGR